MCRERKGSNSTVTHDQQVVIGLLYCIPFAGITQKQVQGLPTHSGGALSPAAPSSPSKINQQTTAQIFYAHCNQKSLNIQIESVPCQGRLVSIVVIAIIVLSILLPILSK